MLNTKEFYQWDINKRLVIEDKNIKEVHFSNVLSTAAIVKKVNTERGINYVDIPNELLQQPYNISAYASCGECVEFAAEYEVIKRAKPDDYIYNAVPVSSGSFVYDDKGNTYITINHNLGRLPKKIMVYCMNKGTSPSVSSSAFTSFHELLHTEAIQEEDGTYTDTIMTVYYTKFSYYTSKTASSQSHRLNQDVRVITASGMKCIVNINKETFQIDISTLRDGVKYFWHAIG